MLRKIIMTCVVASLLGLASLAPASAGDAPLVTADATAGPDCSVTVTFINDVERDKLNTYLGDVRVDGEEGTEDDATGVSKSEGPGPLVDFGKRYRNVEIPVGGASHTVEFEAGTGEHTVEYRVARGPEQHDYSIGWDEVTVHCGYVTPEAPDFTHPNCDVPGAVGLPETTGVQYDGAEDGQELSHGDSVTVEAESTGGYVLDPEAETSWSFTAVRNPCDGSDGTDGSDGQDGTDGQDGDDGEAVVVEVPTRINTGR